VYQTYFDDSGTHEQSEIAIAACYVSTESGWRRFAAEWDEVRFGEGFEYFHMAEFVAPPEHGHKPWCEWSKEKKVRVYNRLASIINQNKRVGMGCAVPKAAYDSLPAESRKSFGMEHYTFAVRICLGQVTTWRTKSYNRLPMQFVFDWENPGSRKRSEIEALFQTMHPSWEQHLGAGKDDYSFQKKKEVKPLQAADILAWQMNNHMRKIFPIGRDDESLCHPGFKILRLDQEVDLSFFTSGQLQKFRVNFEKSEELRRNQGL
jgi:hypothetical protein